MIIQLHRDKPGAEYNTLMAIHRRFPFIRKAVPKPAARRLVPVASPIEDSFWRAHQRLKLRALAGLVRQYKVGPYRLDFALPHQMVGIELDGYQTHSSPSAIAADRKRQRYLESLGWFVIRFGGQEVFNDAEDCVKQAARLAVSHRRPR